MTGAAMVPTAMIVSAYPPTGANLTWETEAASIDRRICLCCAQPGHYQQMLEAHVAANGMDGLGVVIKDGRVLDGHHRVVAAIRVGIAEIPTESEADAKARWFATHGSGNWLQRRIGDLDPTEAAWLVSEGMARLFGTPIKYPEGKAN